MSLLKLDRFNLPLSIIIQIESVIKENIELQKVNIQQRELITLLRHSGITYSATHLAREVGVNSPITFNSLLHSFGIIERENGVWVLSEAAAETDWFVLKQGVIKKDNKVVYYGKWTDSGREFILRLFRFIENLDKDTCISESKRREMIKLFIDSYINRAAKRNKSNKIRFYFQSG